MIKKTSLMLCALVISILVFGCKEQPPSELELKNVTVVPTVDKGKQVGWFVSYSIHNRSNKHIWSYSIRFWLKDANSNSLTLAQHEGPPLEEGETHEGYAMAPILDKGEPIIWEAELKEVVVWETGKERHLDLSFSLKDTKGSSMPIGPITLSDISPTQQSHSSNETLTDINLQRRIKVVEYVNKTNKDGVVATLTGPNQTVIQMSGPLCNKYFASSFFKSTLESETIDTMRETGVITIIITDGKTRWIMDVKKGSIRQQDN